MNHLIRCLALVAFCFLLSLTPPALAAPGDLDPLDAAISGAFPFVYATAAQPDGKTIIAGSFTEVLGEPRNNIARLNADGTLDASFDPNVDGEVLSVVVQADGKVLLGGAFTTLKPNGALSATARNYVARVNADGTLDMGFDPNASYWVLNVAVQADGKVLLGGYFTTLQPNGADSATTRNCIARVNADGTLDMGFDPKANGSVESVGVQADGKVLLGGYFTTLQPNGAASPTTRNRIARVNADGTLDVGFDPKANNGVYSVAVQADGKLLLGGVFTTLQPNGADTATTRNRIARVNADGTLDTGFDPKANSGISCVVVQADGKVLLGGDFTSLQPNGALSATTRNSFARLENDPAIQTLSTPDAATVRWERRGSGPAIIGQVTFEVSTDGGSSYTPLGSGMRIGTTETWQLTGLALPASGLLRARGRTAGGYQSGSSGIVQQVEDFGPAGSLATTLDAGIAGVSVLAAATQPDGKMIITGNFTQVLGVTRNRIARLNADGTLDVGFDPSADQPVTSVAVQADGRILLGGNFTSLQPNGAASPTTRNRIARVNADGTLDTGFNPNADNVVDSVAVQPDGKVLLAGLFTTLQPPGETLPVTRNRIARLNVDGTLDSDFDPNANGRVYCVAVQADGKVLLGGNFTSLQPNGAASPTPRNRIARLNADGTVDTGFAPGANGTVQSVAPDANGRVLMGGGFTLVFGETRNRIARLNANGTLDMSFDPNASAAVNCVAVQADGKVLLGGQFVTLQPAGDPSPTARNRIARLNADGTLDTGFDPNANGTVNTVAVQADGKVLLGGTFATLQPNGAATAMTRNRFARLNNNAAVQSLSALDTTQVLWTRGGAGPEVSAVTFEHSANGGATWTALGAGTRVGTTANWLLTGLALPESGHLRARGRTTAGFANGSSGQIEQAAAFLLPEIEVEHPEGTGLTTNGSGINFDALVGTPSATKTVTVRNLGDSALSGLAVSVSGMHAAEFSVNTAGFPGSIAGGGSGTFAVTFNPAAEGFRTATLFIASNDADEDPFVIVLVGHGLTFGTDTDGDGLNDGAEFQMAALGFDWVNAQPALVTTLFSNLGSAQANVNAAGYYAPSQQAALNAQGYFTAAQVQALHVGTPLLSRDAMTGVFTLKVSLKKTTTLAPADWQPFPFTEAGSFINGQGEIEFDFTVPENAAFFRVEAR